MNKGMKITIGIFAGVLVIVLAMVAGFFVVKAAQGSIFPQISQMMGWSSRNQYQGNPMMGYYGQAGNSTTPYSNQTTSPFGPSSNATPLTIDQASQAASAYLSQIADPNLEIKEIMIFTNNAYIRVIEKNTGIGAMELLVDPRSHGVIPEYGPNRMWNLKYSPMYSGGYGNYGSMMCGYGNYGGRMGRNNQGNGIWQATPPAVSAEMTVTSDQAVSLAQQYLDQNYPGYEADPNPDQFYGYFTIDILQNGNPAGMLSVNGFTGQVFLHTWHGTFITSWEG